MANNEQKFKKLEIFVTFITSIQEKDTSNLKIIAFQIREVEEIFKELQGSIGLDWEALRVLQASKDLYNFCNTCMEDNFDNFIEMLDDDSNITSDTLSVMNFIAKYFRDLKEALENQSQEQSFTALLHFFVNSIN